MSDHLEPVVSAEEAAAAAAFDREIDGEGRHDPEPEPQQREEPKPAKAAEPEPEPERDYEAEALAMGWKPVEDWNGDPEKHRDAKTFVELADNDPAVLRKKYTEEVRKNEDFQKRVTAATKAEVERVKRDAEAQHRAEIAALKQERADLIREYAGNPDAIEKINQNFEDASSKVTNPEAAVAAATVRTKWSADKPYGTDPVFTAAAQAAMEEIIAAETDVDIAGLNSYEAVQESRFKRMDERLAKTGRFPDIYGDKKAADPNPIPENGAPPANSRSIEGARQPVRKSGFDALPADAKNMYAMLKEEGIAPPKDEYARNWENA